MIIQALHARILATLCLGVAISTASHAAHVYVQTTAGVNLYDTGTTGVPKLVAGSPFKTVGLAVGTNGKYFFSNGTNVVHVYSTNATTGAIGREVANIDTSLYSGAACGTTGPTILDHSGSTLYVEHMNASSSGGYVCYSFQTYHINNTTGQLSFVGDTQGFSGNHAGQPYMFSLIPNNSIGYGLYDTSYGLLRIAGYRKNSAGFMDSFQFTEKDPPTSGADYGWWQFGAVTDPYNHLAVNMMQMYQAPFGQWQYPQLGSYTIDASGNISTTNTISNMVTPDVYPAVMNMSPSGQLLAVGGTYDYNKICGYSCGGSNGAYYLWGSSGLQILRFNGANPITKYSSALTTDPIDYIHWDGSNHVYAVSNKLGKMYVYTATTTGLTKVSGSPFNVGTNPTNLIVR